MPSQRIIAHLALFTVALIYGSNYLIAKTVMNADFLEPLGFVVLRVSTAALLFWLIAFFLPKEKVDRKDMGLFALCGLTGAAANQALFFSGLELTTPTHASLIMTTAPILVMIFSFLILKDKITTRKIGGVFLGFSGAIVLMTFGKEVTGSPDYLLGDSFVLMNATSYALYLVLVKRLITKYRPITVMKYIFGFGLLFILPFGYKQAMDIDWQSFTPNVWLAVGYVLICVTFLAYLLNIFALGRVKPTTVGFYIYLQPLLATMLSIFFEMETLSTAKVFSAILIFIGVYLVSDFRPKARRVSVK